MFNYNYIINILNLKDNNVIFKEIFYYESKIKGITHKIFEAYLSYEQVCCSKCSVIFDEKFEKHGFITSNIKIPYVSGFKSILKLHKQRYLCKHCNKTFTLSTDIVNYGCFISNNTKHKIATDLVKKRSFKRYWRLILKSREDLDYSKWKRFTCFNSLMTESDVVNFLINLDDELKQTYLVYQKLLLALKKKNYNLLKNTLYHHNSHISSYMKTSIKTLIEFLPFINNTFNNNFHNGYIEGNNNFIKVIKRIVFGFRSFRRFKARIMICKGLLKIKKTANV